MTAEKNFKTVGPSEKLAKNLIAQSGLEEKYPNANKVSLNFNDGSCIIFDDASQKVEVFNEGEEAWQISYKEFNMDFLNYKLDNNPAPSFEISNSKTVFEKLSEDFFTKNQQKFGGSKPSADKFEIFSFEVDGSRIRIDFTNQEIQCSKDGTRLSFGTDKKGEKILSVTNENPELMTRFFDDLSSKMQNSVAQNVLVTSAKKFGFGEENEEEFGFGEENDAQEKPSNVIKPEFVAALGGVIQR